MYHLSVFCFMWICSAIMGCCCPLHCDFVRGAVVCCVCVEEVFEKEGQGQRKGQEKGKRQEQRRLWHWNGWRIQQGRLQTHTHTQTHSLPLQMYCPCSVSPSWHPGHPGLVKLSVCVKTNGCFAHCSYCTKGWGLRWVVLGGPAGMQVTFKQT